MALCHVLALVSEARRKELPSLVLSRIRLDVLKQKKFNEIK